MGFLAEITIAILPYLYEIRDFFFLNVPVIGTYIADAFQWVINILPL